MADDSLHKLHVDESGAASFVRAMGGRYLRTDGPPNKLAFVFLVPPGTTYIESYNAGAACCAVALLRSFRFFKSVIAEAQGRGMRR